MQRVVAHAESQAAPIESAVDELLLLIQSDASLMRQLFKLLRSPVWIAPLQIRGVFTQIPGVLDVGGGRQRAESWPAGNYLIGMASRAPASVAEVLKGIRTSNWVVAQDVLRAALAMPAVNASELVSTIVGFVRNLNLWYLLDDVGTLVSRLAEGQQAKRAFELLDALFDPPHAKGHLGSAAGQDRAYLVGLTRAVATLLPLDVRSVLQRLIDWQLKAIDAKDKDSSSKDEYSYIWRPAIEDHEQNQDFDLPAKMVSILRDALRKAVNDGLISLDLALGLLAEHKSQLLARLRIYLITEFAEHDVPLAQRTMMDKGLFSEYAVKHEYSRLIALRFKQLTEQQEAEWLGWIDTGPDKEYLSRASSDDMREAWREQWQFHHVHWIRDYLTGPRKQFYDRMYAKYGYPHLSEFNAYTGDVEWEGEKALSIDSLKSKSFEEALLSLVAWKPDQRSATAPFEYFDPDRAFRQYLDLNVEANSAHALELKRAPWHLVGAFLNVMGSAAKDGKAIAVGPILALSDWVLNNWQADATGERDADKNNAHPDWSRDAVVRVIQSICSSRKDGKPTYGIEYRDAIKAMLPRILNCKHKAYVQLPEADDDIRLFDWPMVVVNSPKGNAMIALFAYADWLIDHRGVDRKMERQLPGGFKEMPEVRALLEGELTSKDQSFVSRAPFGWRLGLLHWIDAAWLRERAAGIFELRDIEQDRMAAYGWAAWNCFLFNSQPHVEFYNLLKDQFSYAVDQAANLPKPQDNRREPFARLAEHIVLLYGRGNLGEKPDEAWEADNGIVRRLITQSHPSVAARAVQFVGMSLGEDSKDVPQAVIRRFMELWERYWSEMGEKQAKPTKNDYTFGYWFWSPSFDPKWLIEQLERVVEVAPKPDPDHIIMKRLAKDCAVDPVRCARIVRLMALGDDEGWRVQSWKDEARAVLKRAMEARGEAEKEARVTIDALGRLGYLEFGDLLPEYASKAVNVKQ